jgi:hypothetical protein
MCSTNFLFYLLLEFLEKERKKTARRKANSRQNNPFWEANSSSATQETLHVLWNQNVYYCVHKSPPLDTILRHINTEFKPGEIYVVIY